LTDPVDQGPRPPFSAPTIAFRDPVTGAECNS